MGRERKLTVTVGVPAYNEEDNIASLLKSVLGQEDRNFRLEKIIVISDGSTDGTVDVVKQIEDGQIKVIAGRKRLGKAQRLSQLFRMNRSDVMVAFDADVVLAGEKVIENLVLPFGQDRVALVGGNDQPLPARTLVEKVVNAGERLWFETRKNINDGNSIHNNRGRVYALARPLARSVKIPSYIINDDYFVYLLCVVNKLNFVFAPDAVVHYRSPDNLRDYLKQTSRFNDVDLKAQVVEHFGNWVHGVYGTPTRYKVKGMVKMLFDSPVFISLALLLKVWARVFPVEKDPLHQLGEWQIVSSTKRNIVASLKSLL